MKIDAEFITNDFNEVIAMLDQLDPGNDGWKKLRGFIISKTEKYGKEWLRFELWSMRQQELILSDGARRNYDLLIVRCFFRTKENQNEDEARFVFALDENKKVCGVVEKSSGQDW
jgi:hypothetical protein